MHGRKAGVFVEGKIEEGATEVDLREGDCSVGRGT